MRGSSFRASRLRARSAWLPLLLMLLAGLCFGSSFARLVGPLSPGAAIVDPEADPRTETAYQDCSTGEPLVTVPAAAPALRLVWVRVAYRGTVPAPNVEAASRWIEERFPVSGVLYTALDLEYQGAEGTDPFRWVLYTLDEMQRLDEGAWYVGVLPAGAQPGWLGQALLYGPVVVSDTDAIARVTGHELAHAIGGNPHHEPCGGPCEPMLSTCGADACLPLGSFAELVLWKALFNEAQPRPQAAYEWNRVTCAIEI